jgi:hypothetical protein
MGIGHGRSLATVRSRGARAARRLAFLVPRRAHQLADDTEDDRYPEIFRFVASTLSDAGRGGGTVLSYGCSDGDECFSLRRYLPDARIVGTDVRRDKRRLASTRNDDPNIAFVPSRRSVLSAAGPYDAVFAMSVLCRWPATMHRDDCSRIYPFRRFERAVAHLDALLRPGGLLVIYNANFRFSDTTLAPAYEALRVPGLDDSGFVHLFSRQNRKLEDQSYPHSVFRKPAA